MRHLAWLAPLFVALPIVLVHADTEPATSHGGLVTMGQEEFGLETTTIHVGDRVLMENASHWLHVILPGDETVRIDQVGMPAIGTTDDLAIVEKDHTLVIGPWQHTGTFHVTCQLHPEMNLEVVVLP